MNEIINNETKKRISKKEQLSLDSIMVLRIGPNDSYLVSMLELSQENYDERILIHSGESEKTVIEMCLEENIELERKSMENYMPSDYIEIYNQALNTGRYDICLTMLSGMESYLNQISQERNEALAAKRR